MKKELMILNTPAIRYRIKQVSNSKSIVFATFTSNGNTAKIIVRLPASEVIGKIKTFGRITMN